MIHDDIAWPLEPGWHCGVTGSRRRYDPDDEREYPMPDQVAELRVLLRLAHLHGAGHLHHGACTGWDEAAVRICVEDGLGLIINGHPPIKDDHLSRFALDHSNIQYKPKPYRERNMDIAAWSDLMFVGAAYPEFDDRSRRSGSWMCARLGRRLGALLYSVDMHGELSDVTRHVVAGTTPTEER